MIAMFWVPALTKKGSRIHVLVGRIWCPGMLFVAATGATMGVLRLVFTEAFVEEAGSVTAVRSAAIFLLYLGSITGAPVAHAWRAIRLRREPQRMRTPGDLLLAVLPLAAALGMILTGILLDTALRPVQFAMSPIGLVLGVLMIRHWTKPDRRARSGVFEHALHMGVGGIAAHTAAILFVSDLVGYQPSGVIAPIIWISPTAIGTAVLIYLLRQRGALLPAP